MAIVHVTVLIFSVSLSALFLRCACRLASRPASRPPSPGSRRGGLGRGGLLVWISSVAFSISPATSAGTACSVRAIASSIASRCSFSGFFSTQLTTSRLDARMADAQAQPPVVAGAQLRMDVAQAVVAGVAAAELELGLARHHVEFVVHHQDLFGLRS